MSQHILVVDDDTLITRSLAYHLQTAGYLTSIAASAEEALTMIQTKAPDAILLDVGLPGMSGFDVLRNFQRETLAPVIFVTARRRELDEVYGLELGADDYITKPFDIDVLLARLKTVLRRSALSQENLAQRQPIDIGDLSIDPQRHVVMLRGREVELAPKEFDLLYALAQEAGNVISVDTLLSRIWGSRWIGESQTVYVHVRWLREKIEDDPAQPRRLLTVKGVGYKLVAPTAKA
ncbi:MAG: response regulator transcription factor [Anaerolineae bacterium]|nr:response regulator transcription factor [Anaerolineae bacterium]